jgi:tryptophanyl-tRNA synthetase
MSNSNLFGHLLYSFPTDEEIIEIARLTNKSFDETNINIINMFGELKRLQGELNGIIAKENYKLFPDDCVFTGKYEKFKKLENHFLCHDNANIISRFDPRDIAVVTGFGPSNAPTAGTLYMILKTIGFQKETGIYTHIIIPDLGFLNVRKNELKEILSTSQKFIDFINALGFDNTNGEIRTHNFTDLLRIFLLSSSVLSLKDFFENSEATQDFYQMLNLQGNDYSTMIHNNLCAADILLPIIRDKKKLVIVLSGLEEHYFSSLAKIIINSIRGRGGDMSELFDHDPKICSIYGKTIEGLFPYVKMSKSIPDSSINIVDNIETIREKIINCGKRNEHIIKDMMILASDWDDKKIKSVNTAYNNYLNNNDKNTWREYKIEYVEYFLKVKEIWDSINVNSYNIRDNIFRNDI